jgi:hypothetical protein
MGGLYSNTHKSYAARGAGAFSQIIFLFMNKNTL